ncbi:ATP-binding cassette domain-containing protein [Streptomyces sp. NPDC001876]|uniref:ATP-binding cassette domain-containing protein n=1 Tax=Streptomyces sp. NPDC001876 TaxID=3154402 RepID=UPI003326077C
MDSPHGAEVSAEDFGLEGPRGWAFRGVDFTADPGTLVAIEGPSGSGRTCLLLALTGRMRSTRGHAEVGGLRMPGRLAAVRRISALGPVPGVSELDPAFTVAEHLRERALLQRRFDGSLRTLLEPRARRAATARATVDAALEAVRLDTSALPKAERTSVRDLERLEALRLSVALALMARPRLLAVDDTDLKLSDADRAEAWALLGALADAGTTVLAVCSEAPENAFTVRTGTPGPGERPDGAAAGSTAGTDNARTDNAGNDTAADEPARNDTATDDTAEHDTSENAPTEDDTTGEGTADAIAETGRA